MFTFTPGEKPPPSEGEAQGESTGVTGSGGTMPEVPETPQMTRGDTAETAASVTTRFPTQGRKDDDDDDEPQVIGSTKQLTHDEYFDQQREKAKEIDDKEARDLATARVDNLEILHHVLYRVLGVGKYPGDDDSPQIIQCLMDVGVDEVHSLLTMSQEDFENIGVTENTYTLSRKLMALNYWYNQTVEEGEFYDDFSTFLSLTSQDLSVIMTTVWKPAERKKKKSTMESIPEESEEGERKPSSTPTHAAAGITSSKHKLIE